MDTPAASVIIPAYNSSAFITDTLDSVLAQTRTDFEVIVVNDGSSDTPELERVLTSFGSRVRYLAQQNAGPSAARNAGIGLALGEFVCFLDSDDLWERDFLERQLRLFEADPGLDLAWCDALCFGDPSVEGRTLFDICPSERPVTLQSLIEMRSVPNTSSVVARKAAIEQAGGFDETMHRSEDFDLWIRMASIGKRMDSQNAVLVRHRVRPGSLSRDIEKMGQGASHVYDKLSAALGEDDPLQPIILNAKRRKITAVALRLARHFEREGRYSEAIASLRRADEHDPRLLRKILIGLAATAPSLTFGATKLFAAARNAWARGGLR